MVTKTVDAPSGVFTVAIMLLGVLVGLLISNPLAFTETETLSNERIGLKSNFLSLE